MNANESNRLSFVADFDVWTKTTSGQLTLDSSSARQINVLSEAQQGNLVVANNAHLKAFGSSITITNRYGGDLIFRENSSLEAFGDIRVLGPNPGAVTKIPEGQLTAPTGGGTLTVGAQVYTYARPDWTSLEFVGTNQLSGSDLGKVVLDNGEYENVTIRAGQPPTPISFVEFSAGCNAHALRHESESGVMYAHKDTQIFRLMENLAGDPSFELRIGELVLHCRKDSALDCGLATIQSLGGAICHVARTGNQLSVTNLADTHRGALKVKFAGTTIEVSSGENVVLSNTPLTAPDLADGFARRRVTGALGNRIFRSEVSVVDMLQHCDLLKMATTDEKIFSKIQKMTAALMILRVSHGPFFHTGSGEK